MIKLKKGEIPQTLLQNCAAWTQELKNNIAAGDVPSETLKRRYNSLEIKSAIIKETHGKCAYCESKVRHIAHGDIEHIVPKSKTPDLWFEWTNLTLACTVCNNNKSDCEGIIDPHKVDPVDHFWFAGSVIFPKPNSQVGTLTESVLKLNRPELVDRRNDRLKALEKIVRIANQQTDPATRAAIVNDLVSNELADEVEYAGMLREFVAVVRSKGMLD